VPQSLFTLSLAAFAAIGLPVTFFSSFGAFIGTLRRASAGRVAIAVDRGTAIGFVPGVLLAVLVLVKGIAT
jgi:hypothetical protein